MNFVLQIHEHNVNDFSQRDTFVSELIGILVRMHMTSSVVERVYNEGYDILNELDQQTDINEGG